MPDNILLLSTSLSGGGAERNVAFLSREIDAEVTIGLFSPKLHPYPHGGEVIDLRFRSSITIWGKVKQWLRLRKFISRLKQSNNVKATISFLDPPNLLNLVSGGPGRKIVSVRNFKGREDLSGGGGLPRVGDWLLKRLYNQADAVVAVSEAMRNDLETTYGVDSKRLRVINNACDTDAISSESSESIDAHLQPIFGHPTIINVGRMGKQKGQWHLIRSFRQVKESIPEARLVILGDGHLRDYFTQLSESLGLRVYSAEMAKRGEPATDYDVHLLGFQTNPYALMKLATIFALPSLYEGFPNVLLEAMAVGLPILASDCLSGPREILAPDLPLSQAIDWPFDAMHGILMPVCDGVQYNSEDKLTSAEQYWVGGIMKILNETPYRNHYHTQSQRRVLDFSVDKILKQWESLLAEHS